MPSTWWEFEEVGHNDEGQKETAELLGKKVFSTPKPVRLLKRIITLGAGKHDIVLDFFSGSGAFAQAILELNKEDAGMRRFVLVQLPECIAEDSPAFVAGFKTISDITKERVRRVINKLTQSRKDAEKNPELNLCDSASPRETEPDLGFRVFKLAESNFKPWNAGVAHDAAALQQQLELHIDHIRDGRSADDILYEILLKSGFPLTTPVETLTLAGKTVHSVASGALFICLERELTLDLIRAMAEQKPERVVCLDEGFAGNDQLKANAVQVFKTKGVRSFKTV